MKKVNYDYQLFYAFGGSPGSEPYVDTVEDLDGKTYYRIFLCADSIDWKEFSKLSLAAIQAHILQPHPMYEGQYIQRDFEPLKKYPAYIVEDLEESFSIWVNIQVKDVLEFELVRGYAKRKIEEIEAAKRRNGLIWKTQVSDVEFTKYKTNETESEDVNYLLEKFGIYTGTKTTAKF